MQNKDGMFRDINGKYSPKRLFGSIGFSSGILMGFIKLFVTTNLTEGFIITLITTSGALLAGVLLEKHKYNTEYDNKEEKK